MSRYLFRRAIRAVIVVAGVSFISFFVLFLSGDPIDSMVGEDWTVAEVNQLREDLGLDEPWLTQYFRFVARAVRGDFGESTRHKQPAFDLIAERIPATLELAFAALFLSIVIAVPVGIISATKRGTMADYSGMLFALLGQSIPVFWLSLMFILIFGVKLHWLPVSGKGGFSFLILPAVSLATYAIARNARMVRSSMLEVLRHDYVTTARAKGVHEFIIVHWHALRNALIPVVTIIGLEFGHLLGGPLSSRRFSRGRELGV